MKVSLFSLLAVLIVGVSVVSVNSLRDPLSSTSFEKAEDSLDSSIVSPEESKELQNAEADVAMYKAKVAASQASYDLASKPFKASHRLQEAEANATDAENLLQDTENEFDDTNETLIEDRKEENASKVLFSKANASDTKLKKKVMALKKELTEVMKKEAAVKQAHNLTVQAYQAHRLADAKIKLSIKLKEDADAVTAGKAKLLEERKELKAQLVAIKTALHGEDNHTKSLLITIRTEKHKLGQLPKGGKHYQVQKDILDNAIHELYAINGKKSHVVAMKQEARELAKAIKNKRDALSDAEEKVHRDAGFLQEMARTGKIPKDFIDSTAAGAFNEKALFLKDVAAALNVSGIRNTLTSIAKKYHKRHNTTLRKALEIYDETRGALKNTTGKFSTLTKSLFEARLHFKNARREANTISAAEHAQYHLDKAQAEEVLREAQIGLKLANERVERAKQVMATLTKALAATTSTQETIEKLMVKPERPIAPGKNLPTLNPPASPKPEPVSQGVAGVVDNLVKQAVWGEGVRDNEVASVEELLRKSLEKKENISKTAGKMKFKQVNVNSNIPEIKPYEHCLNGKKDFDEAGVDCGGSCPRRCGMFHVQQEEGSSRDSKYHVVNNIVPNRELVGSETFTPTYVKSINDLLVPGADVTTKTRPDTVPIMNDGKFQPTHHRFKEFRKHSKLKHHLRHRIHHHRK